MATERSAVDIYGREFQRNAVIFEEGDPGSRMYVIQSGHVRIQTKCGNQAVTLAVLRPGDFFGEMALLESAPRSASAVVDESATLVEVDEEGFAKMVQSNGEIALRIMRKLSARLRDADRRIHSFLAADGVARAVEVMRAVAGPPGADGHRPLPDGFDAAALAARAGIPLAGAEPFADQLARAGIVRRSGAKIELAPNDVVKDFLRFVELKGRYEPLVSKELAELAGLPEDEVHRILTKVLYAKLTPQGAAGDPKLSEAYEEYVKLRRRFDFAAR